MAAPTGFVNVACDDGPFVASPTWVRLDASYKVTRFGFDVGRSYELDKTGTGRASFDLIDTTGAFDPTNSGGTFYGRVDPLKQAALCLPHAMTGTWYWRFRGFISSISWVPYVTLGHANVHIELIDWMGLLGAAEMVPDGSWGDFVLNGDIVFDADPNTNAMQTRLNKVADQYGIPTALRQFFTGNVKLQQRTYAPRTQALVPMLDAVDGEFPDAGNLFVNTAGTLCAHGRLARFFPDQVASGTNWDFTRWSVGDKTAAAASPGTVVPIVEPLVVVRDDANIFTSAIATPQNMADGDIPAQYVQGTTGGTYGVRTWSAENLATGGGASGANAATVTKMFSTYHTQNYGRPLTRIGQFTVVQQNPVGPAGTAVCNFLCQSDISDIATLTTTHTGGGGFNGTAFFIEGLHMEVEPMRAAFPRVTLTVDASPTTAFASNPFPTTPTGGRAAATGAAKVGTVVHT